MAFFEQIIATMMEIGMEEFLPWLLILSVTYGILEKYEVISDETQVNGVVSLSVAFLTIIGANTFIPDGMWAQFAAHIAFGIFGMLALMILLALAGYDLDEMGEEWSLTWIFGGLIAVVSFISVLVRFGSAKAFAKESGLFDQVIMPFLTLVFVLALVYIVTTEVEAE
ncbi:MAG: hypothetical protein ABEI78_01545 [Candidatus Nanohaloarchaea archaeon]